MPHFLIYPAIWALTTNCEPGCRLTVKISPKCQLQSILLDTLNPAPRHPNSFSICDTLRVLFTMANIPYHLLETLARLESALPDDVKELLAASDTLEKTVAKVDTVLQLLWPRMVPWVQVLEVKSNCFFFT